MKSPLNVQSIGKELRLTIASKAQKVIRLRSRVPVEGVAYPSEHVLTRCRPCLGTVHFIPSKESKTSSLQKLLECAESDGRLLPSSFLWRRKRARVGSGHSGHSPRSITSESAKEWLEMLKLQGLDALLLCDCQSERASKRAR